MSLNHVRPWRNIYRRKSRTIHVGPVPVGGEAPITVQTMTNTDTSDVKATVDQVIRAAEAGADHPIRVERDAETGEPSPYVLIRANLEALIDRKSFYRLVDLGSHASHDGVDWFGIRSGGRFFPIIPAAELQEQGG